jgi:hypothetical protein
MSAGSEWRALVVSAAAVAAIGVAWVGAWATREATDVDPTALERMAACLGGHGLEIVSPADDPLADSAPRGSLTTTIDGNTVTVSFWNDSSAAEQTVATYNRLTPEDLTDRAITRGNNAFLWAARPTDEQASILYGCEG